MYKKGDFHIHSTASDGGFTPEEIVLEAKSRNIDIISITDHNTMDGLERGIVAGRENGIRVIPGVELSSRYNNCRVHILGYFDESNYNNPLLRETLANIKKDKVKDLRKSLGKEINFCGYKNKICTETGIDILRYFGAIVVLAHPVLLCKKDMKNIMDLKFDGIEAKYFKNTEEETEEFIKFAKDKGIIYTAGSDFHDYIEYYRLHGMIGDVYLDENEIKIFLDKLGDASK